MSRERSEHRDRSRSRSHEHSRDHGRSSRDRSAVESTTTNRSPRSRSPAAERDNILQICWKPVKEDAGNFDAWTHLLQCVEQMDESKPAREAYDEFFKRYPYCYGYWRKYAELERRHKHIERAIEVYDRGTSAIALSVDLWLSYLALYKDYIKEKDGKDHKIRHLYEKAIAAAGLEFRSDKLWEDYISWELKGNNLHKVTAIYDRLLQIPTQLYSQHFERFQEFVNTHSPDKILSDDEYDQVLKHVENDMTDKNVEIYVVEEVVEEVIDSGENKEEKPPPTAEYRRKYNDEALKLFRIEILDKRRKVHLFNEHEVSKRWQFEEGIKRPYFHVKPLERAQIRNWRAYLDFEIDIGNSQRIIVLFERCLIACALYEDMWLRYAHYLETRGDVVATRAVYKRAASIHCPKKSTIHLAQSAFEEKNGDFEEAKSILADFDRKNPGYLIVQLRRIGIDRRQALISSSGNRLRNKSLTDEDGITASVTDNGHISGNSGVDFSSVIARYEKHIRDPRNSAKVSSFYALKFARFHAKMRGDRKLAEKIIKDALGRDKDNVQLYTQLIDLAFSAPTFSEQSIIDAFDYACRASDLSDEDKMRFSQRKLEFLEDFGSDISVLQEHLEYHAKLCKAIGTAAASASASSKRKHNNDTTTNTHSSDTSDKRSRTSTDAASSSHRRSHHEHAPSIQQQQQQLPPMVSSQPPQQQYYQQQPPTNQYYQQQQQQPMMTVPVQQYSTQQQPPQQAYGQYGTYYPYGGGGPPTYQQQQ